MGEDVKILFVDDERNVLKAIERLFIDDDYDLLTASSGDEGLSILENEYPVQLVISDYKMPGMNGVDFLRQVCQRWPDTIRIVFSGHADTTAVIEAINEGQIYKFIQKPWNDDGLKITISNSLEFYFLNKRKLAITEELYQPDL
jgi:two-component system NtrC family sensor kinase